MFLPIHYQFEVTAAAISFHIFGQMILAISSPVEMSAHSAPLPPSLFQPKGTQNEWIFLRRKSYILGNTVRECLMCLGSLRNEPSLRKVKCRQCTALLKVCY